MEKFSVLISVYHREKGEYLREALRSVFEQSVPPSEVVLVKDGILTDELDRVVEEFMKKYDILKVVTLPHNIGLGGALNEGMKKCSYELVARMDSDDICMPNRFEKQLAAFAEHGDITIVGGWISEFESNSQEIISYRKPPQTDRELKIFAKSKCPFNHVTVMFKKSAVQDAGGYQHLYLLEDYWLWIRMINNGALLHNVQRILVNVRGGTAMVARRGGYKYAKSEVRLQTNMLSMGMINILTYCKNVFIRFSVRVIPNTFRIFIYKKFLR